MTVRSLATPMSRLIETSVPILDETFREGSLHYFELRIPSISVPSFDALRVRDGSMSGGCRSLPRDYVIDRGSHFPGKPAIYRSSSGRLSVQPRETHARRKLRSDDYNLGRIRAVGENGRIDGLSTARLIFH